MIYTTIKSCFIIRIITHFMHYNEIHGFHAPNIPPISAMNAELTYLIR